MAPGGARSALGALGLAAAAVAVAAGALALDTGPLTALDRGLHDRWLPSRTAVLVSPSLVVARRDAASEARLGAGAWDRAVLARTVTGLARAGAAAVGLDLPGRPGAPGRGGAAGEALLGQAIALAGQVVVPVALTPGDGSSGPPALAAHPSWLPGTSGGPWPRARPLEAARPGLPAHARGAGHTLVVADADGVVRRTAPLVRVDDRLVPSLAVALGATAAGAGPEPLEAGPEGVAIRREAGAPLRVPVDRHGATLVDYAAPIRIVSFLDLWSAIEAGRAEDLRGLVGDRVVLVLAEPPGRRHPTPVGPMSGVEIQAYALNGVLTGFALREPPPAGTLAGAAALAALAAWAWLAWRWWLALAGLAGLGLAYLAAVAVAPAAVGLVLPVWTPLASLALASAGALLWAQYASARRLRGLARDVTAVREALVRRESAVEALEEDLEATRAAVARSAGAEEALRAALAEARAREEQTRQRLAEVEREARALRPAARPPVAAADPEHERLRQACERVGIVTVEPAVLAAFADLEKAARAALPILLAGEPGTGKELFARAAHRLSPRAGGPFVAVNMAAIAPELFESELFGHVRGAFTGAVADRKGLFEQAHGGTLFLDEIGELRPEHQGKLLRALQERAFHRVGAARPTAVDVRIVAASNRDLERGVAEGWFREDLYFRLKGLVLRLPPLRERPGDLPRLAARFLAEAAAEAGRPGLVLSEGALAALAGHAWPGNVRELANCLRQAAALADGAVIDAAALRLPAPGPRPEDLDGDATVLGRLRRHGFDMQATARALGLDRSTVTQRLKGLGFRALVDAGGDRTRAARALAGDPALERAVELKLAEYHEHLLRTVAPFPSAEAALAACRRRFKNLPERHFPALEALVRRHFETAGGR